MKKKPEKNYALGRKGKLRKITPPELPYRPGQPKKYNPGIGLIGCGGITKIHLTAYRKAGYRVLAICDLKIENAIARQKEFFPKAAIYDRPQDLLARNDIDVVDIATHPQERFRLIEMALKARKHVLSQKPFVLDLNKGKHLVRLAEKSKVKLAVNQNARWAPDLSYMYRAVHAGVIGKVSSVEFNVHWNHNWVVGSRFDQIHHLLMYDFAIHWFDLCTVFFQGQKARSVYSLLKHSPSQKAKPPLIGQILVEYGQGQASLNFNGDCLFGQENRVAIVGSKGALRSTGPSITDQKVTLYTESGMGTPKLKGKWFPDGFHGTMAELLCSIEKKREPFNSGRQNLESLALCFAAVASANTGKPQVPGKITKMPK